MLTLCEGTCKILCLMDVEMVLDCSRIRKLEACYSFFMCLFVSFAQVLFGFSFVAERTGCRSLLTRYVLSALALDPLCQPGSMPHPAARALLQCSGGGSSSRGSWPWWPRCQVPWLSISLCLGGTCSIVPGSGPILSCGQQAPQAVQHWFW